MGYGITVTQGTGGSRVAIQCIHQNVLIYATRGEASWVCSEELLHAHAIAGFLKDLVELEIPQVESIMQKWGVYCRARPLEEGDEAEQAAPAR